MTEFEKRVESKFSLIRQRSKAFLFWLFPPTRCVGMRGTCPVHVIVGRALFDIAGWIPTSGDFFGEAEAVPPLPSDQRAAITVGIEVKENGDWHTSMRIIAEDGSGSGLQAHQLEALAAVHRDGGIARVLWSNGGQIGVLGGEEIAAAWFNYGVSVQAEKMRKEPAKGSRSIPWSLFTVIDFDDHPEAIVQVKRELTVSDEVRRAKKIAARKISKKTDERPARKAILDGLDEANESEE